MSKIQNLVIDRRIFGELIRKVIALKFNKIGIYTREFYSEDVKQVFMILKAQQSTLSQRAAVNYQNKINVRQLASISS